ncbi:MAG: hypothetical protein MI806_27120 [Minwuiales bacterium]|nr:hypothetical protein [Minwuiales bacterium]
MKAVLGPTNTGKTHLAVERMLGHATGVIGLPLRLLAREIYDRVVAARGARSVALVTGEEKIVPPNPAYFVCTVESMPLGRDFDFLAVDEIQLCADPERGHVFTDRLLRARGREETMFLGADTIRGLLTRLLPEAEVISRQRFSTLAYAGSKKLSRLPRRSAVVAFSADDVYAIAELMRRQRGGAAVVMGALSPRTRNAQVAMYQAGEVDFMVATDAIGIGLNMDIDHVAFASLKKFDGAYRRALTAAEIGQIAGRAGRHMNDGTFGTSVDIGDMDPDLVELVEGHKFDPLKQIRWRNADLSFSSPASLIRSLEAPAPRKFLLQARDAVDMISLRSLARDAEIAARATGPAAMRLLWDVCQVPDFRKTMHDHHVRLLGQIYRHLTEADGVLPADWVAKQIDGLSRTEGDIDTLATRIAHIRTWTYISHRSAWTKDPVHWQERARAIEDRLSDALHEGLTQRFVDRQTAILMRRMKDRSELTASVNTGGEVHVEGHYVGRLAGLSFVPEAETDGRAARAAVNRVLGGAVVARGRRLAGDGDDAFSLGNDGLIEWDGAPVAELVAGDDVMRPRVRLKRNDHLGGRDADLVRSRLQNWIDGRIDRLLGPLKKLGSIPFTGPGRGIAFQLVENLGVLDRAKVADQLGQLDPKDFGRFKYNGVTLGREMIFLPLLLKPEATRLRCLLWAIREGVKPLPEPPPAGAVSFPLADGQSRAVQRVAGYRIFGGRAVRVDMLDRVSDAAHRAARRGPVANTAELMSLIGCGPDDFQAVMGGLGYRRVEPQPPADAEQLIFLPKHKRKSGKGRKKTAKSDRDAKRVADSPFAVLRHLGGG